jgi:hypothetical protein
LGLYGTGFGVGAVVYDSNRLEIDNFVAYADYKETDEYKLPLDHPGNRTKWIEENVIPSIGKLQIFVSIKELRNSFWIFYRKLVDTITLDQKNAPIIIADCGYPVEANFFRACVMVNIYGKPLFHFMKFRHALFICQRKS